MTQTSKQTAGDLRAEAQEASLTADRAARTAAELHAQAEEARAAAREAEERFQQLRTEVRRLEQQERRDKESKAYREHYEAMYLEHGGGLTKAQHAIVYMKAYEYGHSSGYSEVEVHYEDLVEMVREVLRADEE